MQYDAQCYRMPCTILPGAPSGVRYPKSLFIQHYVNINMFQNPLIDINIFKNGHFDIIIDIWLMVLSLLISISLFSKILFWFFYWSLYFQILPMNFSKMLFYRPILSIVCQKHEKLYNLLWKIIFIRKFLIAFDISIF